MQRHYEVIRIIKAGASTVYAKEYVTGRILGEYLMTEPKVRKLRVFSWIKEITRQATLLKDIIISPFHLVLKPDNSIAFLDVNASVNRQHLKQIQTLSFLKKFSVDNSFYSYGETIQFILAKSNLYPKLTWRETLYLKHIVTRCFISSSRRAYCNFEDIHIRLNTDKERGKRRPFVVKIILIIFLSIVSAVYLCRYFRNDSNVFAGELQCTEYYKVTIGEFDGQNGYYRNVPQIMLTNIQSQEGVMYRIYCNDGSHKAGVIYEDVDVSEEINSDGIYNLDFWVEDENGNCISGSESAYKLAVDSCVEQDSIQFIWNEMTRKMEIVAWDRISGVECIYYQIGDGKIQCVKGEKAFLILADDFEGYVSAYCTDKAGNEGVKNLSERVVQTKFVVGEIQIHEKPYNQEVAIQETSAQETSKQELSEQEISEQEISEQEMSMQEETLNPEEASVIAEQAEKVQAGKERGHLKDLILGIVTGLSAIRIWVSTIKPLRKKRGSVSTVHHR